MVDKRPVFLAALAGLGGAVVVAYVVTKKSYPLVVPPSPPQPAGVITPVSPSLIPELLATPSAVPADNLPSKIPLTTNPLVSVLVPAGTEVDVYHIDIQSSYAGIISDFGNNMYTPTDGSGNQLFYYDFTIDGDLVERVKRIIANPNSPYRPPQPYLATQSVNWRCHNGTKQDLTAIVYCNGFMQRRRDT